MLVVKLVEIEVFSIRGQRRVSVIIGGKDAYAGHRGICKTNGTHPINTVSEEVGGQKIVIDIINKSVNDGKIFSGIRGKLYTFIV